jgi:hypothetical protein
MEGRAAMNARLLQALGIPGFLGVGLMLFCLSYYAGTLAPLAAQLDSTRSEARKLTETLRTREPVAVSAARAEVEVPAADIAPASAPIEIIRRLNAAAETAVVTVDRASYTIAEKNGLRRMEVSLPTKGSYLHLRAYLRDALLVGRDGHIDSLVLQRARAIDPIVDADLKLSFQLDTK